MFRTHLFGSPSIIVYTPAVIKSVLYSEDKFSVEWPGVELFGRTSMVAVHGKAHTRVRSFITNAINRPQALNRIAAFVQPRMASALQSWAQMGKINAKIETQKVIKIFFSYTFPTNIVRFWKHVLLTLLFLKCTYTNHDYIAITIGLINFNLNRELSSSSSMLINYHTQYYSYIKQKIADSRRAYID